MKSVVPTDTLANCLRSLEIKPNYAPAHMDMGIALYNLGQFDNAVRSYRRAIMIKSDYAEAHCNLGNALYALGQLDNAAASYRLALKFNPGFAAAHYNLGHLMNSLGQLDNAVASYRRALAIKPDYCEAHINLGNALRDLGKLDDAVKSYHHALEIKPDFALAHSNLGTAFYGLEQFDNAGVCFRRALEINPNYAEPRSNLLFTYNYLANQPASVLLTEAQRFGDLVTQQAHPYTDWHNTCESDRCLRVGLVSGDFCNHPVGYFIEGVLASLASNAHGHLELIAYPSNSRADAVTERIKAYFHKWHSAVGLSDESLAQRIRDDGIDILIDLSGHTAYNRLSMFAWKPAPVQASWLGYFATTGVAAIDYLIADHWTAPEAEKTHFTEKIWRLPETYLCFTAPNVDVQITSLPALTKGQITFGCFNRLSKMNDDVVALWARVLQAVPGSCLLLKAKQLKDASAQQNTIERFVAHNVNANRLILEGLSSRKEHLAAYHRVDIALDPFPYPGGTTSIEGLWMGVPVITKRGDRFLSHVGETIAHNAGLSDWIAVDEDDYVAKAVYFASDLGQLAQLRAGLRQQVLASPLFDTPRFARHFKEAMRGMWYQWLEQRGGS